MGLLGKRKIRGLRAQLETGHKTLELAMDTQQMWAEHTQELESAQQAYEEKVHDWTGPDFEPIAGVTIQQYAAVCKAIEATPGGAGKMAAIAEGHGVAVGTWDTVSNGWIARCAGNAAVAQALNDAYRGVG